MELTQEIMHEFFDYDEPTGQLIWKERQRTWFATERAYRTWNTKFPGKPAGCIQPDSGSSYRKYVRIKILGTRYRAHRLIWLYLYAEWPTGIVDHINANGLDNRRRNLADITHSENMRNLVINIRNTSGECGVYFYKRLDKWCAIAQNVCLGYFEHKQEAIEARHAASIARGFHENHGMAKPPQVIPNPMDEPAQVIPNPMDEPAQLVK